MAKKEKEVQEVHEEEKMVKKTKSVPYVQHWFDQYCVNNKKDIEMICQNVAQSVSEQFCINTINGYNVLYAAVFYETFMSIIRFIKDKQKRYNEFSININDLLVMGYTNNDDDSNEKVGNFFPVIQYAGKYTKVVNDTEHMASDKTNSNLIRWKELNVKQNIEFIKKIQIDAYEALIKNMKINLKTDEAVIPIFCTFMYYIGEYVKYKFKEANQTDVSEISINVLGLFDIYYSYDEEDKKEIIEIMPGIKLKLALKEDETSGRDK